MDPPSHKFFSSASDILLLPLQVLSMILDHGVPPDVVNRHKQVLDPIKLMLFFCLQLARISLLPAEKSPFLTLGKDKISSFFSALQTPLMLAAMHGKIDCVLRLLQAGANVSKASNS
jgi:E3 ubiquitin-protein ligase XBAT32/33